MAISTGDSKKQEQDTYPVLLSAMEFIFYFKKLKLKVKHNNVMYNSLLSKRIVM